MTSKKQIAAAVVAAADEGGTIQAAAMVPLAPGRPELHTTMSLRGAAEALGVASEVQTALGTEWA